jgi:transposase
MSLARLVVTAVKIEGMSKSAVAREYGLSRRWVITLVRRFEADGEAGLHPVHCDVIDRDAAFGE